MTTERTPHQRTLAALLGILALLMLAFHFRALPHTLDSVRETNTSAQFDTARAIERIGRVLDGTPHPPDSAALDLTRDRLLREIRALGYAPETRLHHSCFVPPGAAGLRCAQVQNIFFRAGPDEGPALVLSAHYDSWDASPGFGDDGLGLTVWLEVAHLLAQQELQKPVVFLFTDGEEIGMLGANAFVEHQADYGFEVGRIINLEARGVRGPSLMFETSHPNAGIVRDWARNGARRFSNSMMTAIYELLPNSTDLTVHLDNGFAGINIAIADGRDFYHTNRDDLSVLDRRSVQHMGDQALGAARAFLDADWSADQSGGEIAYADILSRVFVILPQTLTQVLLVLCFAAITACALFPGQLGQRPGWRAWLLPPAFLLGAGLLVSLLPMVVGLFRPEPTFWLAYPQALNMAIVSATLLVAVLLLIVLTPGASAGTLFASGSFWLLFSGVALSLAIPGFAMLYLIPGLVLALAAGIARFFPQWQTIAQAVAAAWLVVYFFPLIELIQVMMGLATPAIYAVMIALVLAPALALLHKVTEHRRMVVLALAGVLVASLALTISVPAYNIDHPLGLNFTAHYDTDEESAAIFASARQGLLPADLREQMTSGEIAPPAGLAPGLPARVLDYTARTAASINVVDEQVAQDARIVTLQFSAPDARLVRLALPPEARPLRVQYQGLTHELSQGLDSVFMLEISGRSADGAVVEIMLGNPQRAQVTVQGIWSGLPEAAKPLAGLRPESSVRTQIGDITATSKKQDI